MLKSSKLIWQGMVHGYTVVIGTNAMVKYRLHNVHSDRVVVPPISLAKNTGKYIVSRVLVSERTQLAPGESQ